MDFLNLVGQLFILYSPVAQLSRSPFVVSRTGYMKQFAGCLNRKSLFFMALLNGHINMSLSYF